MTSPDAFTGRNFRRGGFLKREGRYARAEEFLATVRELGDSWQPRNPGGGQGKRRLRARPRPLRPQWTTVGIRGEFTLPRTPQGQPIVTQAGDSDEGREFAAKAADVIFSRHGTLEDGQAFFHDVKRHLAAYGRDVRPRRH